jgi:ABC-type multidrug transport system permease subunit
MKSFIPIVQLTEFNRSLTIALGQRLIRYGLYLSSVKSVAPILLVILSGVISVAAQTPSGTFFDGNSAQLGNSLRSVTFFLAAGMIIAGIIFVAVGIITSGLRESLSTWKFITGAACFAFGGICAAIYAFSQGETVPLDNQF